MANAGAIRAGKAFVELYADDNKLVAGLRRAQRRLQQFGSSVRSAGLALFGVGTAAVTALAGTAKLFADMGDAVNKASQRTGIAVETLSELGYAAEQSGLEMSTLEGGLRRMAAVVVEAAQGSKTAQEALSALGLSASELGRLSPDEQFKIIADRIAKIENPTQRAAVAMDIFGRSGTQMLPMLREGRAGIEALQQRARELGLTMSGKDAQAATEFGDILSDLWKTIKMAAFQVGAALAPTLKELAVWITGIAKTIADWVRNNQELVVWILRIAAVVAVVGAGLIVLGSIITAVGSAISAVMAIFAAIKIVVLALLSPIALVIAKVLLVVAVIVAVGYAILKLTGLWDKAMKWLGGVFQTLAADFGEAMGGIKDALMAGDIGLAAKILWLTLKLEWERGIAWLKKLWLEFNTYFFKIGIDYFYSMVKASLVIWHGLEIAWVESTNFLSNTWTRFCQGIQKAWNWAGTQLSKGWNWLRGLFDDSFDSGTANAGADKWLEEQNRQIDERANAVVEARKRQRDAERQAEDAIHNRAMQSVADEQNAKKKALEDSTQSRIDAAQAEVDAARKEWQDAIRAAKDKRAAKAGAKGDAKTPGMPEFDFDVEADQAEKRRDEFASKGIFNAMAAASLSIGGASALDRQTKAAEKTAENTSKTSTYLRSILDEQKLGEGGLTFG